MMIFDIRLFVICPHINYKKTAFYLGENKEGEELWLKNMYIFSAKVNQMEMQQ